VSEVKIHRTYTGFKSLGAAFVVEKSNDGTNWAEVKSFDYWGNGSGPGSAQCGDTIIPF
jgi:hypothetical protein